jgi:hypothetical protein
MAPQKQDGFCNIAARFDVATGIRIAKGLGVLRKFIRGNRKVLRDIGRAFDLYDELFKTPEPETP